MKLATLGLLLAAFPAQAQQTVSGPIEGANVIAFLLADSGIVTQNRLRKVLATRGYLVQAYDSTSRRIETNARPIPGNCLFSIEAVVLGHTILLSGTAYCSLRSYSPKPVSYSAKNQVPDSVFPTSSV